MPVDGDEVHRAAAWLSITPRKALHDVKDELQADLRQLDGSDPDEILERTFNWCLISLYRSRVRKSYQQRRTEKRRLAAKT